MSNQEIIEKKRKAQLRLQSQIEELEGEKANISSENPDDEVLVYSQKAQAKVDKLNEDIQELKKELQSIKPPEPKPEDKPIESKPEDKPKKKGMSFKTFMTGKE